MLTAFASLETLQRKLLKSLSQRGVVPTLGRCLVKPWRFAADLLSISPERRAYRREELEFDRKHGVDTCREFRLGWLADVRSPNWIHSAGYAPAPLRSVLAALNSLRLVPRDFTFIDFGSGKGRTLLVASQFPFRRILGVEYLPRLHAAAVRNIAAYKSLDQRCHELESICDDATNFVLPPDPAVLFFFHPFDRPVFARVVERIELSLLDKPRKLFVVYCDPKCADLFLERGYFRQILSMPARGENAAFAVFES